MSRNGKSHIPTPDDANKIITASDTYWADTLSGTVLTVLHLNESLQQSHEGGGVVHCFLT